MEGALALDGFGARRAATTPELPSVTASFYGGYHEQPTRSV